MENERMSGEKRRKYNEVLHYRNNVRLWSICRYLYKCGLDVKTTCHTKRER